MELVGAELSAQGSKRNAGAGRKCSLSQIVPRIMNAGSMQRFLLARSDNLILMGRT